MDHNQTKLMNRMIDVSNSNIDKKWFYSVITRTIDLNYIYLLEEDITPVNNYLITKEMVNKYLIQDKNNKNITENIDMSKYIDADYIIELYERNKFCKNNNCGHAYMSFEKSNVNKVTVNRKNNYMPHYKENCEIMCKTCNIHLSNKL